MKEYQGVYHVLRGAISPMEGIGPEDINIPQLLKRLHDETVQEVILATNLILKGSYSDVYLPPLKTYRH